MFSNQLGDAITASLVSGLDPMNQIARGMFTSQAKAQDLEYYKSARTFVKELEHDLEVAIANSADEVTVNGIRALITRFSGTS